VVQYSVAGEETIMVGYTDDISGTASMYLVKKTIHVSVSREFLIVLQNVELQNVELQNAEFQNIELQNAELQNAELQNVENYKTLNLTERRHTKRRKNETSKITKKVGKTIKA
jgi:hypothetical protein